ncbi:MAG: hypothetical protein NVS3B20_14110 [Polyangiales bacterium]
MLAVLGVLGTSKFGAAEANESVSFHGLRLGVLHNVWNARRQQRTNLRALAQGVRRMKGGTRWRTIRA